MKTRTSIISKDEEKLRLSKRLSELGLCSRREAEFFIDKGWVSVNGETIRQQGTKVTRNDRVELSSEAQKKQEAKVTILLNKPLGIVSNMPEEEYKEAKELITPENRDPKCSKVPFQKEHLNRLSVAGRLDINSTGLLVLTQDGTISKVLIEKDSEIEKEYLVRVKNRPSDKDLEKLRNGSLELDGKKLKPAVVEWVNENQLRFILKEGKKRQIRRMLELVDVDVAALKRVRVGAVMLGSLPLGKWRYLRENESFLVSKRQ